jgi:nucleoside-diphosphate-sugar epimerase
LSTAATVGVLATYTQKRNGTRYVQPSFLFVRFCSLTVTYQTTWEETLQGPVNAYYGAKKFAERAAWDYVEENKPGFDLVVLNPPMVRVIIYYPKKILT